jgi:hypothetical protein
MSRAKTEHLGMAAFRQQCERFLGVLDDTLILENYVRMFGDYTDPDHVSPDHLKGLLMECHKLAMSNYSAGPQTCLLIDRTLSSVTNSCFFGKDSLSPGFVSRWLEQNLPRLVPPIHSFCVHKLSTSYRMLEASDQADSSGETPQSNLGLSTPVLEKASPFPPLLPVSLAWLLAGALPPIFSRPLKQSPISASTTADGSTMLASQVFAFFFV